ncbi:MAG: hypothetical protein LBT86_00895 [Deltaproteobacteria bacterium]|jgi:predicted helicase|nr:hypothetical protein [Deltaproteobacteria bacterium]
MVNFLKTYQVYDQKFSKVWLWREWPLHWELNPQDIGIDLVAEAEDSQLCAQCKRLKEDAYVDKLDVDSFLGASGKRFKDQDGQWRKFSHRLWISTTNNWSSLAEIHNQIVPFNKLNLIDLESAAVDWGKLAQGDYGSKARL